MHQTWVYYWEVLETKQGMLATRCSLLPKCNKRSLSRLGSCSVAASLQNILAFPGWWLWQAALQGLARTYFFCSAEGISLLLCKTWPMQRAGPVEHFSRGSTCASMRPHRSKIDEAVCTFHYSELWFQIMQAGLISATGCLHGLQDMTR